jgi:AcrR family transcriptional regulator
VRKTGEATRARILAAAQDLFAAQGFHGARVDEIARRSRSNKERIYAYFSDKEGLYAAVMKQAFSQIARAEEELCGRLEGREAKFIESWLREYMEFHRSHPHFWRLLAWENLEGGRHAALLGTLRAEGVARLRRICDRLSAAGRLPPGISFEAVFLMIVAVSFFWHANAATMTQTLGIALGEEAVRTRLLAEMTALFSSPRKAR